MENLKKLGEIKNKLRKIYPNNHENFKNTNSKSRVQLLALSMYCNLHYYRHFVPKFMNISV